MATTIGTIQLIATIDTSQYKKGASEIDRANKNMETSGNKSSSSLTSGLLKVAKIGMAAIATATVAVGALIAKNFGNAIKRVDTLNNSTRTFKNMGFTAKNVNKTMSALEKSIKGLPTPLDNAITNVTKIAASINNLPKSQKVFTALNNAIIGFGGNAEMASNAVTQLSQDLGTGRITAQTWLSLTNSGLTPALAAMARQMGITTKELKSGLSEGTISVDKFMSSLIELDTKGGGGMQSFAKIAKDATSGIGTGWANMNTAITRGVANIINAIGSSNISASMSNFGTFIENGLTTISKSIPGIITEIKKQFESVSSFIDALSGDTKKGDYKSFGERLGKALANALNIAIKGIKISMDSISNWFKGIDWGKLGIDIGRQSIAFVLGFVIGLLDFDIGSAWKVLADNWLVALIGVLTTMFAPAKLLKPIAAILKKIPLVKPLLNFFVKPLRALGEPVRLAVAWLFKRLGSTVDEALRGIGRVFKALFDLLILPVKNLIDNIAIQIRLLPTTFSKVINFIKTLFLGLFNNIKLVFIGIWNVIKTIFQPITAFFKGLFGGVWAGIKQTFSGVPGFFNSIFTTAWNLIKNVWGSVSGWFLARWNSIKSIFSTVSSFFGNVFKGALNRITNIFGGLIKWFSSLWGRITSLFGKVGTTIGNAIGNAFKSIINSVIGRAVNIINGFIRAINGAIGVINKIPKVNISRLDTLGVPKLASGGIVAAPTLALVGEGSEPEAVIPLSKLDKMLNNDNKDSDSQTIVIKEVNISGIYAKSRSDVRELGKEFIGAVNDELRAKQLPQIAEGLTGVTA